MADGRRRALWGAVSSILAQQANINRNPKRRARPYRPEEFNPTIQKTPLPRITVSQLSQILKTASCRKLKPAPPTSSS
jgi:hypothetical protein